MGRNVSARAFGQYVDDDRHGPYKHHFACFACRKAWKPHANTSSQFYDSCTILTKCPECEGPVWDCGPHFKAPKQSKVKAWARLERQVTMRPTYPRGDPRRQGQRLARAWAVGERVPTLAELWKAYSKR